MTMTTKKLLLLTGFHAVLVAGMIMFMNQPAFSQEIVTDEEPVLEETTDIPVDDLTGDTEPVEETTERKFDSRERLTATLLGELEKDGEEGEIDDIVVEEDIPTETDEPVVENSGDTESVVTAEADPTVDTEPFDVPADEPIDEPSESGQVTAFVDSLSDEQVFALNRSLNNVVNSELEIEYDMELLQKIVDEDYNKQQINSLTQALEQEARFLAKYEETGDDKFLAKAERQKEKFLVKTEFFGGMGEMGMSEVMKESRQAAKIAVKEARMAARDATKEARMAARDAAKDAVKSATKGIAKRQAKSAIKDAIKLAKAEVTKENNRGGKKGKN